MEALAPLRGLMTVWSTVVTLLIFGAIGWALVRAKGVLRGLLTLGLVVFFVSVPVVVISVLANAPEKPKPEVPERRANVDVLTVRRAAFDDMIVLPMVAESPEDSYVKLSAEVSGRVVSVKKRAGDPVEAGEVIVMIDQEDLLARLAESQATVNTAEKSVVTAQATVRSAEATEKEVKGRYGRVKDLFGQRVRSQQELDAVEAEWDRAKAEVARAQAEVGRIQAEAERAKASLRVAEVAAAKGTVRSPIKGTLDRRYVDVGEFVTMGSLIAEVVNVDRMYAVVQVPESDRQYVNVGDRTAVVFHKVTGGRDLDVGAALALFRENAALARLLAAEVLPAGMRLSTLTPEQWRTVPERLPFFDEKALVRSAGNVGDAKTRTYRVQVEFNNRGGRIKPGMIGVVVIRRRQLAGQIVIPIDTVISTESERFVYVVEDRKAVPRRLDLGLTDGERFLVLGGLEGGEQIIREPRQVTAHESVSVRSIDGQRVPEATR